MHCGLCGQTAREDEVIHLEGRWICAACKPAFVQQLREGCLVPVAPPLPDGFDEHPLAFGDLVAASWRLLLRDWVPIGILTLLVAVPINLVVVLTEPGDDASWREFGGHFRTLQLLELFIGFFASLGIAKIVSERLEGRAMGVGGALRHAFRRWLPGIGTNLVGSIIIVLLLFLLIVPGIIWAGYYSFSTAIVSLRDRAGMRALDYSKSLVRGRWWAVMWRLIGLVGLSMLPMIVLEVAIAFAPESAALSYTSYLAADLFYTFVSVGSTVLFLNLEAIQRRTSEPVGPAPWP